MLPVMEMMAELFQKDVRTIKEHIKNIYAEGVELTDQIARNFLRNNDFFRLYQILFLDTDIALPQSIADDMRISQRVRAPSITF